jgi:glycosyltransferase involved in cell wall biosynthesis
LNILLTALQPVGGIRTYFRYVYSDPLFKDANFTLLAPDDGLADFLQEYLPKNRITLRPVKNKRDFVLSMFGLLKKGEFDLVHSHGFSAGIFTYICLLFRKVTHLMTAHDVFTKFQFKGVKGALKKGAMNYVFNRIDCIHTVTQDANSNLLEFFPEVDPRNLNFIPHGIDSERFKNATPRNFIKELRFQENQPLIGFFGRFMGQKGFRVLVDALKIIIEDKQLPNPIVLTFGWGGFIREDYQYIDDHGLSDYFIQMPNTNDMPAAIKGVDVVAMPSRWEACGLLGMEVLCCGTAIVGTNCIGLREVLADTPAVIINIDDTKELANGLVQLIKDDSKLKFSQYVNIAVERYSVKNSAKGMYRLYHELIIKEH